MNMAHNECDVNDESTFSNSMYFLFPFQLNQPMTNRQGTNLWLALLNFPPHCVPPCARTRDVRVTHKRCLNFQNQKFTERRLNNRRKVCEKDGTFEGTLSFRWKGVGDACLCSKVWLKCASCVCVTMGPIFT